MEIRINLTTKPIIQYYQHKEDRDVFGYIRPCAVGGCPAVFVINEPASKVQLTKDWQYYLVAINYKMNLADISSLMDYHLAFCNNTGTTNPNQPRRDYILGKNLNAMENNNPAYPRLDKDRTCSRNTHTGVEVGDYIKLTRFDGRISPPMKAGKPRPLTIAEIKLEDYMFNPKDNPEMFVTANMVSVKEKGNTSVSPFPRGAIYEWTNDNLPRTFLPLISNEPLYDLKSNYIKLPLGTKYPSPYRIYP